MTSSSHGEGLFTMPSLSTHLPHASRASHDDAATKSDNFHISGKCQTLSKLPTLHELLPSGNIHDAEINVDESLKLSATNDMAGGQIDHIDHFDLSTYDNLWDNRDRGLSACECLSFKYRILF